jgi:hypothetical protein
MSAVVRSVEDELRRYKALAEAAIEQLDDSQLVMRAPGDGNSIAILCWHISGNLASRFTDFLTSDGEKPWRTRDEEFVSRQVSRAELVEKWEEGWRVALGTLSSLSDDDLARPVTIRGQPFLVYQALHRALGHVSSHVGQIVLLAKAMRGAEWRWLSIPPGQSAAYNQRPAFERPAQQANALRASELAAVMSKINDAWRSGRPDDMAPLLAEDVAMTLPGFSGTVRGRDTLVESFREFARSADLETAELSPPDVTVAGSVGVASVRFTVVYRRDGQRWRSTGRDVWVFGRDGGAWRASWRMMLDLAEEAVARDPT